MKATHSRAVAQLLDMKAHYNRATKNKISCKKSRFLGFILTTRHLRHPYSTPFTLPSPTPSQ
jgi:hypothetical protein